MEGGGTEILWDGPCVLGRLQSFISGLKGTTVPTVHNPYRERFIFARHTSMLIGMLRLAPVAYVFRQSEHATVVALIEEELRGKDRE